MNVTLENTKKEIVDIVIITFNRLKFLQSTISKINERTKWPFRLIVVDNNSFDGTRDWLRQSSYKHILLPENKGLAGAMVEGYKLVESEYFIFTQDDAWPPDLQPCWLEQLLRLFKENEEQFIGISMSTQKQPINVG